MKPIDAPEADRAARWRAGMQPYFDRLEEPARLVVEGKLTRMVGLTLEAVGVSAAIGDRCDVIGRGGERTEGEVVGFAGDRLFLMPVDSAHGLSPNARVVPRGGAIDIPVGEALLGRVVDGRGVPLDGRGPLRCEESRPLHGPLTNPLDRAPIDTPLDVGVRALNGLLTIGRGQRVGLMAPSGVGKSVLLGMMARFTSADVIVVGLVGERGREVKEFIEDILGAAGLARSVVIATPADTPPLLRTHGAMLATSVAEYFRDQGRHVLLLMDSLTRYAQAQREIALTIGEPPATRGYPPSVFALLPQLVERAGNGVAGGGSITGIYTVLTDGDDNLDPIAESAMAILDGHIVLSRQVAESGRYPAIDVEASISRVMPQICSDEHRELTRIFRYFYSSYEQNRDLFNVGAYKPGVDADLDRAVALYPRLVDFLRQDMREAVSHRDALAQLAALFVNAENGAGSAEAAEAAPA